MDEEAVKAIDDEESESAPARSKRVETYMLITAVATSIIVLAIAALMLYFVRSVVIIYTLAFLVSYILSPAVRFFEERRVNRVLIVSIFYVLFVAAAVLCVVLLFPVLWNELKDLQVSIQNSLADPGFGRTLSAKFESVKNYIAKFLPMPAGVDIGSQLNINKGISGAASWMLDYVGGLMKALTAYSGKIIWLIIVMILIPFITFFLLKDSGTIIRAVMRIIPIRYSETTRELMRKIDRQIGRYIRGRIAEAFILSALTVIGLRILNVRYYFVIGGIAGFANLIPYIGPVGIAIPAVLLAAFQHGMLHMVITGIFLGSLQVIDNAIIVPLVVGKSVDLHPIVTIFVIFVGAQLLGLLGMIIAVPLTSIIIATFQAVYKELKPQRQISAAQ